MSYFRQADGLTREQVLADLKAILGSEYFRQYEICGDNSRISTDFVNAGRIGGLHESKERHFTLGEIAGCLEAILDKAGEIPGGLLKARLMLYPSAEVKKRLGLNEKDVAETWKDHVMGISVGIEPEDGGVYKLNFYNPGLEVKRSAKYRRQKAAYDKWYAELDAEFQKALPHMPEEPLG